MGVSSFPSIGCFELESVVALGKITVFLTRDGPLSMGRSFKGEGPSG